MSESWGYRCATRFFWSMFDGLREIGHPIWTHLELWKWFRGHPRQNCKWCNKQRWNCQFHGPNHMFFVMMGDDRRSEVISQPSHCWNLMENMGCVQQGKGGRATIRYPKEPCDIPIVFLISAFERTIWTHILNFDHEKINNGVSDQYFFSLQMPFSSQNNWTLIMFTENHGDFDRFSSSKCTVGRMWAACRWPEMLFWAP